MPIPDDDASTTTTTLAEWVDECRYHLDGNKQGPVNVLASDYVAASGTCVFLYDLASIQVGTLLSIGENTLLVLATNEGTKTCTVVGGWASSKDANAESGTVARVNPRFTDHRIVRALNAALSSLSAPDNGLYAVNTELLDYTSGVEAYELDVPDFLRVLAVRRQTSGVSLAWPRLRAGEWSLIDNADTDVFPSGLAIRILCAEPGYAAQVVYAATFAPISGMSTLASTTGIAATAEDIPPLGAAINLMAGREVSRNSMSSQGDTRRPDEVPSGSVGRSYGGLVGQYRTRVQEEARRLRAAHPLGN